MEIAVGSDHAGFELKSKMIEMLKLRGHEIKDFGSFDDKAVDYPDIARAVAKSVSSGETERALLFCGTGIGMSIAANKVRGVRAVACTEYCSTIYSRLHNNANILCLGGRILGVGLAEELVRVFLTTEFEQERHAKRVNKITDIENEER